MALKKASKVTSMFTAKDYEKMAKEYDEISSQIKVLEARKKSLADQIKIGAETLGVKDDKGSYYLETPTFIVGRVAKKSLSINQEKGVEVLKKHKLNKCVEVITKEVVNEDALSKAVSNGEISLDQVQTFTEEKVSYQVSVKAKEEMVEVEQSTLSVAKRK